MWWVNKGHSEAKALLYSQHREDYMLHSNVKSILGWQVGTHTKPQMHAFKNTQKHASKQLWHKFKRYNNIYISQIIYNGSNMSASFQMTLCSSGSLKKWRNADTTSVKSFHCVILHLSRSWGYLSNRSVTLFVFCLTSRMYKPGFVFLFGISTFSALFRYQQTLSEQKAAYSCVIMSCKTSSFWPSHSPFFTDPFISSHRFFGPSDCYLCFRSVPFLFNLFHCIYWLSPTSHYLPLVLAIYLLFLWLPSCLAYSHFLSLSNHWSPCAKAWGTQPGVKLLPIRTQQRFVRFQFTRWSVM